MVGPPPIASSVARARSAKKRPARASSASAPAARPASSRSSSTARHSSKARIEGARLRLLGEAIHDLDAGEVALVDGAVVGLAGERLLVDAALGVAVEQTAVARLQLEYATGRLRHQPPHQLLVVDPAAAVERVGQMRLERVGGREHGVVAALHHAGAAGAAEEPFDHDRNRERG